MKLYKQYLIYYKNKKYKDTFKCVFLENCRLEFPKSIDSDAHLQFLIYTEDKNYKFKAVNDLDLKGWTQNISKNIITLS